MGANQAKNSTSASTYNVVVVALVASVCYCYSNSWHLQSELQFSRHQLSLAQAAHSHLIQQIKGGPCLPEDSLAAELLNLNLDVLKDENEEEEDPSLVETAERGMAGVVAFVMIFVPAFLCLYLDSLPEFLIGKAKAPPSQRLAYKLDTFFSNNACSKPFALLMLTVWLVLAGSFALFATSRQPMLEILWSSLAGVGLDWTFVSDFDGMATRVVALWTSLGGLVVTALMLGIVSEFLSEKMDEVRQGKSTVLENGHTLILGWSDKVMPLVAQISNANESEGGGSIVILSEVPKEEMEESVQSYEYDAAGTEVVCRSGSTLLLENLKKVSVSEARSIVVLASGDDPDLADAFTLRVVLSLAGIREKYGLGGHVVVEVQDADNADLVRLVGGDCTETMVSADIIGRLMVQCGLQPGLSGVYEDLLGFEGSEFYIKEWPELKGRTYLDATLMFEDAILIGVVCKRRGKILLNPPNTFKIQEGDELIVIAEDDDTYQPSDSLLVRPAIRDPKFVSEIDSQTPKRVLFLGWRRDLEDMISVLDSFVCKGSTLTIACELSLKEREARLTKRHGTYETTNLELKHVVGEPSLQRVLDQLDLESFDFVIILAREDKEDIAAADSSTLNTLLQVRNIQLTQQREIAASTDTRRKSYPLKKRTGLSTHSSVVKSTALFRDTSHNLVVAEILDSRTRYLLAETGVCAYVLSNELISKTLSMVAENRQVFHILTELFQAEGNELYIHPIERYIKIGENLSFMEVVARARLQEHIIVGHYYKGETHVINPPNKLEKRVWRVGDSLIILASEF